MGSDIEEHDHDFTGGESGAAGKASSFKRLKTLSVNIKLKCFSNLSEAMFCNSKEWVCDDQESSLQGISSPFAHR